MTQNIYIDVYFGFNFLMDFVVLLITGRLINNKKSRIRITLSAIIASVYASIALVLEVSGFIVMILTYFVIPITMLLTAFGKTSIKCGIKNLLILYFVTFVISGTINTFYYGTGKSILERAKTDTFGDISISFILCVLIISVTTTISVIDIIKRHIKTGKNIFKVTITVHNKTLGVTALCDTGNSLTEPITKKPVSVIEKRLVEGFIDTGLKHIVVPYNSVGKSHGLMHGFISDSIEVDSKVINNAIIGIYDGKLSQSNEYQMLLHPDMINDKER